MIKHLDLFSGIGGFALAARWAGLETVAFCEKDEFCQKVLKKHWPDVPIYDDIKDFNGKEYKGVDLLTGGYPCQPFSEAGKRKGEADDRHLWPEMLRVIEQARPAFVIAENVIGHVTLGLDKVLNDLEREGYAARPLVIPACAVDSPHRRDRVWIVAYAESKRCNNGDDSKNKREADRKKHPFTDKSGYFNWLETRRWACEPSVPRVVNGLPDRVDRNRSLGNAIVPQLAYAVIHAMLVSNA
ncbi:MAG: DNA (cytosine-5-)-methyltransferase [Candidatus Nanopelagicaceae bacterium]|nr:DNA (cytosine-5-)-methyltransferase [Candidatus Nanopelagicaceae bacterium]